VPAAPRLPCRSIRAGTRVGVRFNVTFAHGYTFPWRGGWLPADPALAAPGGDQDLPIGAALAAATSPSAAGANGSCPDAAVSLDLRLAVRPSGKLDGSFSLAASGFCDSATIAFKDDEATAQAALQRLPGLSGERGGGASRGRGGPLGASRPTVTLVCEQHH
jgi:hypothetical protein